MKKILLLSLLVLSINSGAQTLTQSFNEPVANDLEPTARIDTSQYTSGMPKVSGNNVIWDFTKLAPTIVVTNTYAAPSSAESATYPGCTVVQRGVDNSVAVLKSITSPSQTEMLGLTTNSVVMKFTNSGIIYKYPTVMGNTHTDLFNGTYVFGTYNGNVSGTITTTADGIGTLNLPSGKTFNNVLRVQSVQTLTFSLNPFPGKFADGLQTTYNYYHSSLKWPIFSINYQSLTLSGGTPTISAIIVGSPPAFSVGMKENNLTGQSILIYPNPVSDILNIKFATGFKPEEIMISDQYGQLVKLYQSDEKLELSGLNNGLYLIRVKTPQGYLTQKLIKE